MTVLAPAISTTRTREATRFSGKWKLVKLADVAEIIMGQAPRGDQTNFDGNGTVFVKAGEFGSIRPVIREWTTNPLKFAKSGDVLMCVVGATCGKLNLAIECAIGRSVAAIRPNSRTFDRFIHFQLMPKVLGLRAGSTGSAQGVLSKHVLENIDIVLPPLDEQRRIVAQIEKQFTRLDAGVALLKRVQTALRRYEESTLKAACEGRLLPTDTKNWKELTLPEFASTKPNSIRRGPFGSAIKKAFFVPKGYKVYQQQNAIYDDCSLGNYFIDREKFEELSSFEVKPDDLIISCSGTLGRIAIVPRSAQPGVINQALLKLTLDQDIVSNHFFVMMFRYRVREFLIAGARGAAMQNIAGVSELKKFRWNVPPLAEQQRIVAEVQRRLSVIEEIQGALVAMIQRAAWLRQSILQRTFSAQGTS